MDSLINNFQINYNETDYYLHDAGNNISRIVQPANYNCQSATYKNDYLQKSKSQKSAAWALLGSGSALIIVGVLIGNKKNASFADAGTGVVLGGLGLLSTLGSIPLFIASGRNKRKALNSSTYFKFEKAPSIQQTGIIFHSYPTISFKINL
ncbi:MAG: hypothetical protein ABIP35_07710 [Ginsengibacter sp.]